MYIEFFFVMVLRNLALNLYKVEQLMYPLARHLGKYFFIPLANPPTSKSGDLE
jgi:hypothetical protein